MPRDLGRYHQLADGGLDRGAVASTAMGTTSGDAAVDEGAPACPFCDIVSGRGDAEVVFDDYVAVAFLDRTPLFPGHTLVIPRRHVLTLPDLALDEVGPFYRRVQHVARIVPEVLSAQGTFVANNNVVSQSVAHLHVHVVPRTRGDGLRGFFWPRSKYAPGEAADVGARLRGALTDAALDGSL